MAPNTAGRFPAVPQKSEMLLTTFRRRLQWDRVSGLSNVELYHLHLAVRRQSELKNEREFEVERAANTTHAVSGEGIYNDCISLYPLALTWMISLDSGNDRNVRDKHFRII